MLRVKKYVGSFVIMARKTAEEMTEPELLLAIARIEGLENTAIFSI